MYLGIDLGGTNIAVGLVDENNNLIEKLSTKTLADRPFSEIVSNMADTCQELLTKVNVPLEKVTAIGIGSPGAIDNKNGIVLNAGNLNWTNAPLKQELGKYFSVPINIENDANAAAYGEYSLYDKSIDHFIFMTLGTGIGGGIIINKKIYCGFNGVGAEIGHSTFLYGGEKCTCGKNGCYEAYGSVTALIRQTSRAIEKNPSSLMAKEVEKSGEINGRTSFDAAKNGDEAAKLVVKQYLEYVAEGICSLVNVFEPEVLLIGGGISKEGNYLLDPIKKYCEQNYFCKNIRQTKLEIAKLGNDAGVIGAALAAKDAIKL